MATAQVVGERAVAPPAQTDLTRVDDEPATLRLLAAVAAAVLLLPYAIIYLINIWSLAHYQFYPVLLVMVAYLAWERVGGLRSGASGIWIGLLSASLAAAAAAVLFASVWMGFLGWVLALAAAGSQLRTDDGQNSLALIAFPLLILWQPPFLPTVGGDVPLISALQIVSASLASQWLDMLWLFHANLGTVIELPGRSYGVAEACSGVQSFFAVLTFAVILALYNRRGPLHAWTLIISSVVWAILMNTLRIVTIVVGFEWAGLELESGWRHDALGYATMGAAMLLLLSSDSLLAALNLDRWLRGSADAGDLRDQEQSTAGNAESSVAPTIRWQRVLATCRGSMGRGAVPATFAFRGLRRYWLAASLLLVIAAMQVADAAGSLIYGRNEIDFFVGDVLLPVEATDAPQSLTGMQLVQHETTKREFGAEFGERSDTWIYRSPSGQVSASLDQAFPGWHELTKCYELSGFVTEEREIQIDATDPSWPWVQAKLRTSRGENALLLFALFDRNGQAVTPPGRWDLWASLRHRLINRLNPVVRQRLFASAAYQVQLFETSSTPFDGQDIARLQNAFGEFRRQMLRTLPEP